MTETMTGFDVDAVLGRLAEEVRPRKWRRLLSVPCKNNPSGFKIETQPRNTERDVQLALDLATEIGGILDIARWLIISINNNPAAWINAYVRAYQRHGWNVSSNTGSEAVLWRYADE